MAREALRFQEMWDGLEGLRRGEAGGGGGARDLRPRGMVSRGDVGT